MSGLHIRRAWRRVLPVPCLLSDNLKFQLSSITILMFCLHNYPWLFIIKYGKTPPFRHLEEFIRNVFIKTCQQRESQSINLYLPAVRGGSEENVSQRALWDISHQVHCRHLSPPVIGKGQTPNTTTGVGWCQPVSLQSVVAKVSFSPLVSSFWHNSVAQGRACHKHSHIPWENERRLRRRWWVASLVNHLVFSCLASELKFNRSSVLVARVKC